MKRIYSKFRIGLMTFALGLASVFMINGSLQFSDEASINLPETNSKSVILVYPKLADEIPKIGDVTYCKRRELSEKEMKEINLHSK